MSKSAAPLKQSTIKLTPRELRYAFGKRQAPLPRPKPEPFDEGQAVIESLWWQPYHKKQTNEHWLDRFSRDQLWSKEEALFWFTSICEASKKQAERAWPENSRNIIPNVDAYYRNGVLAALKNAKVEAFSASTARTMLQEMDGCIAKADKSFTLSYDIQHKSNLAIALLFLLPFHEFLELWIELFFNGRVDTIIRRDHIDLLLKVIIEVVAPYITSDELIPVRRYLEALTEKHPCQITSSTQQIPLPYLIAAILGMADLIEEAIESIPDGLYSQLAANTNLVYQATNGIGGLVRPDLLLFGLQDSETLYRHFKRTGLFLTQEELAFAWIAHFGQEHIGPLVNFAEHAAIHLYHPKYTGASSFLNPIFKIKTVESASAIFHLSECYCYKEKCYNWLRKNAVIATEALQKAITTNHKAKAEAESLLKGLANLAEWNARAAELTPEMNQQVLSEGNNTGLDAATKTAPPAWLAELFARNKFKQTSFPAWYIEADIPNIEIDGYTLSEKEKAILLSALKHSKPDNIHPLLIELRERVPRKHFDDFVWFVFTKWRHEGGPSKDQWCMLAVGILGSDYRIAALMPLMKEWRTSMLPARANFALNCIKASGTDASLMLIHKVSMTASLGAMRRRAQLLLSQIAAERKLTPVQLEDRLVPSCCLDDSGQKVFDFGTRRFYFVLGSDLKALVKDESGKMRDNLPAPNKEDDPAKAAEAEADWKEMKKLIKGTAQNQVRRLEQAMIGRREWSQEEFEQLLVKQPLMFHLCKPLVWGIVDQSGKLLSTFRITEEKDFADENDKPVLLSKDSHIRIVHPLELTPEMAAAWSQLLADYDLVPHFLQLSRAVKTVPAEDIENNCFAIIKEKFLEPYAIPSILEKRNWERGETGDGGYYFNHDKYFAGANVWADIRYSGIISGAMTMSDPVEILHVSFASDAMEIAYKDVDPIVLAEVYSDIVLLMEKGTKS